MHMHSSSSLLWFPSIEEQESSNNHLEDMKKNLIDLATCVWNWNEYGVLMIHSGALQK